MMCGAILLLIGLANVVYSGEVPEICMSPISNPQPLFSDLFHLDLQVFTESFLKNTFYDGNFVLYVPVNGLIIQAREKHGSTIYGYFTFATSPLRSRRCAYNEDSLVGEQLPAMRYPFTWKSNTFTLGDIQFWIAIQTEEGGEYTWFEGPSYRAATDYDGVSDQPTGESTTHKIYYIVVPCSLFALMTIMVVGGIMTFFKVKYGTVCCCSDWGTPIQYRYARKYRMRPRPNRRNDVEQPPSYDNTIQEENRIARQNVARFEAAQEDDLTTDDRVPLTEP